MFLNDTIFFAIIAHPEHAEIDKLKEILKEDETPENVDKKLLVKKGIQYGKGKVWVSFIFFRTKRRRRTACRLASQENSRRRRYSNSSQTTNLSISSDLLDSLFLALFVLFYKL